MILYIDPGSGSLIFQIILAGFLGGVYAVKLYWKKIKDFFNSVLSKKKDEK